MRSRSDRDGTARWRGRPFGSAAVRIRPAREGLTDDEGQEEERRPAC